MYIYSYYVSDDHWAPWGYSYRGINFSCPNWNHRQLLFSNIEKVTAIKLEKNTEKLIANLVLEKT